MTDKRTIEEWIRKLREAEKVIWPNNTREVLDKLLRAYREQVIAETKEACVKAVDNHIHFNRALQRKLEAAIDKAEVPE